MIKKIYCLSLIFIAILGIGAISALDSQNNGNNTVTIGDVDFDIPVGFKENTTLQIENETRSIGSVSYVLNSRAYETLDEKVFLTILVSKYDNVDAGTDIVDQIGGDYVKIDNKLGFLHEGNNFYSFTFLEDGKIVSMTSNNPDLFDDFIN